MTVDSAPVSTRKVQSAQEPPAPSSSALRKGYSTPFSSTAQAPSIRIDFGTAVGGEPHRERTAGVTGVGGCGPRRHLDRVVADEQFLAHDADELARVRVPDFFRPPPEPFDVLA